MLLVSHDRAFLDNVVTSTLVFEGDGRVQEYVGGYDDWLRQRAAGSVRLQPDLPNRPARAKASGDGRPAAPHSKKLSYKEQRELDGLPGRIDALESEQHDLNARIAGPDFYKESRDAIAAALSRVEALQRELADAYARWHDLDSRATLPARP